jgi:hypothetical protein
LSRENLIKLNLDFYACPCYNVSVERKGKSKAIAKRKKDKKRVDNPSNLCYN